MKTTAFFIFAATLGAAAQSVTFDEDALSRGYYDRPWQRYEAEPGRCVSSAEFLLPESSYSQQSIQAEASNLTAAALRSKGDYVEWTVDRPGRGLTLRFSLPDSPDGTGLKGNFELSVDGTPLRTIEADSYWAWQYTVIAYSQDKYPDNEPADTKFARMRFDEVCVLLDEDIPSGATLRLSKADDNTLDYVVDFIELEPVAAPVTFDDIEATDKVAYPGEGSLATFISQNSGKTIYIPAGTYNLTRQLTIPGDNTRLIGAGMWYTELYFSTPSDQRGTYNARGVMCNASGVTLEGMSLNTVNNKRYYLNNPSYQVGKGLNGNWGTGSCVRDLRVQHFECGGWIMGARNLTVERCRFRNNYADGINLANNSTGCTVSHCSFRNNGDDDMASWSTGAYATDNTFEYCTAENNWRASSLGFFGGCRGCAHHIAIYDAMEAGARVVCDFDGTGFSTDGCFQLSDITIRRSGALQGTPGTQGGFWGDSAASLQLGAGWAYDLRNVNISRVDIYDSRFDAISIKANSGKRVENITLSDINIYGVDGYAYGVNIAPAVKGYGTYARIHAEKVTEPFMSDIPAGFDFVDVDGITGLTPDASSASETCCDILGRPCSPSTPGLHIVKTDGKAHKILVK